MSDWTPEEDAAILANYHEVGTRVLAEQLGRTRNMIIGRARRLGLSHARPRRTPEERMAVALAWNDRRNAQRNARRKVQRLDGPTANAAVPPKREGKVKPVDNPPKQGVSLLDLEPHHCRSLLGYGTDSLPIYCGITKRDGSSYCYMHHSIYHMRVPGGGRFIPRPLKLKLVKSGSWA